MEQIMHNKGRDVVLLIMLPKKKKQSQMFTLPNKEHDTQWIRNQAFTPRVVPITLILFGKLRLTCEFILIASPCILDISYVVFLGL